MRGKRRPHASGPDGPPPTDGSSCTKQGLGERLGLEMTSAVLDRVQFREGETQGDIVRLNSALRAADSGQGVAEENSEGSGEGASGHCCPSPEPQGPRRPCSSPPQPWAAPSFHRPYGQRPTRSQSCHRRSCLPASPSPPACPPSCARVRRAFQPSSFSLDPGHAHATAAAAGRRGEASVPRPPAPSWGQLARSCVSWAREGPRLAEAPCFPAKWRLRISVLTCH